eukprot:g3470.t1
MLRGPFGLVATSTLALQLSPASSFGGSPFTRPPFNTGSTPGTAVISITTYATASSGHSGAHTLLGAKAGLFSSPARSRRLGRADGALSAGGSKDGDVKEKATETKPAAKKSSIPGGMGGWDWGFTSTSKKTTPDTAAKPKKPVFSADDEAAEIEAVKRKAAAEIKAEQEEAKGKKAAKMSVPAAAEPDADLEEADEIAEIKRQAAAEVEAEKEKAKANKKEEDAKFAEAVAARVALRKRAEEMAAVARGDSPKSTAPAAKKSQVKKTPAEAKPPKAEAVKAEPAKPEPAKPEPAKPESTKAATPAKSPPKKSSGGGGLGGWDWGFTPSTKSTATKAKPAAAPAKKKTEKPKPEEAEAKKENAAAAAATAAAAAKEEKAAAVKAEQEKAEQKKTEQEKAKKEQADKEKAEKEKAEKEKAKAAAANEEAAAARAAKEKRAEEIAAKARGDVPEPKQQKAAPKAKEGTTDAVQTDAKTQEATPGGEKTKDVKKPAEPKKKDEEKQAEPKKKETPKPAVKTKAGFWGMAPREVAAPTSLTLTKPETIVVVTGATGRVGSLAVRRLLELYPKVLVRAVVNDLAKGSRLLKEEKDKYGIKLEIISAELGGRRSASKIVDGASAVVFCASGFAQNLSPIQRLANAVRLTINPSSVADVEGVRDVALALKETKKIVSQASKAKQDTKAGAKEEQDKPQPLSPNAPRFVLLSSAAVTRPNWSPEEKKLYPLAADVPIVKLNPLNILTVKAEGEKQLREVGIPYTVVRPCGLNDDHPRGRPLFSVGDTAAGRICREDVADVLVRCLGTKEATGKTFEVQSLPGFEKVAASNPKSNKGGIDQALSSLPTDEALEDPDLLQNYRRFSYPVLTQLRPVPLAQTPKEDE